jgi:hypothetical protein
LPSRSPGPSLLSGPVLDLSGVDLPDFSSMSSPRSVPRAEIPRTRAFAGTRADLPQPPPGARKDSVTGQWIPRRWAL